MSIYRSITVHIGEKNDDIRYFPGTVLVFSLSLSAILTGAFMIFYYILRKYFVKDVDSLIILMSLAITPCLIIIQTFSSILQAKKSMLRYNIKLIAPTALLLAFMLVMIVLLKTGVNGALFSYLMSNLLAAILGIYFVKNIIPAKWQFSGQLLKKLIKDGIKLHLGVIATFIFLRVNMFMIGYYKNISSVGYYAIASSLSDLLILIPASIQHVFYSRIPDMMDNKIMMAKKTLLVFKHAFYLSIMVVLLLCIFCRFIILFMYGNDFLPYVSAFLILLPGVWFFWQSSILAYYLVGMKKFLLISFISIGGSLINVFFNIIFIQRYDYMGAALASSLSYCILGVFYIIGFFRVSKYRAGEFINALVITREDILYYKGFFWK